MIHSVVDHFNAETDCLPQSLQVEILNLSELSPAERSRWQKLADHSDQPNPFFRPEFLIPLSKYVCADEPQLLVVRESTGNWLGLSVLREKSFSARLPFPHLSMFHDEYIFVYDLLLDQRCHHNVLVHLFEWISVSRYRHGVRLQQTFLQEDQLASIAQQAGLEEFLEEEWQRPAYQLEGLSIEEFLKKHCSKSRRKSLNRAHRKLAAQGPISFSLSTGTDVTDEIIDTFLKLEHAGWKGVENTSIASDSLHKQFFLTMTDNLRKAGILAFGELKIGSEVIASTCNFIDAGTLFAFKIGWNPDFADGSPGIWAELKLMESIQSVCPQVTLLDSCSQSDSYLSSLWPEQLTCRRAYYTQSRRSRLICYSRDLVRKTRNYLHSVISNPSPEHAGQQAGQISNTLG